MLNNTLQFYRKLSHFLLPHLTKVMNDGNGKAKGKECLTLSSVQSLSRVRLFATPWIAARQASLSITNSGSSLRLTSIESVMPSSHLILCRPLLLLPPIPPSIRVFSTSITWLKTPLLGLNRLTDVHLKTLSFKHFRCVISAPQIWPLCFEYVSWENGQVTPLEATAAYHPAGLLVTFAVWALCWSFLVTPITDKIKLPAIFHKCPCMGLWLSRQGPLSGQRK